MRVLRCGRIFCNTDDAKAEDFAIELIELAIRTDTANGLMEMYLHTMNFQTS